MLRPECNCTLIGNVISTNFEESLNTLNYVERCKAELAESKNINVDAAGVNTANNMLVNLKQLNEEYKKELEQTEQKHFSQFETLKSLFSLDIPLNTMLQRGLTPHDKVILENHRQAPERVKNFTERNNDLNTKLSKVHASITRIKEKIEDKSTYFNKLLMKLRQEMDKLTAECAEIKEKYNRLPMERTIKLEEERKKLTEEKHNDLEQTLSVLFTSHRDIDQLSQTMFRATTTFENTKKSIKSRYKTRMKDYNMMQNYSVIDLEEQFKKYWMEGSEKIKQFMEEAEQYCKGKREYKRKLKNEVQQMLPLVQAQATVIKRAEDGDYTEGIRSLRIKRSDKPWTNYQTMSDEALKKSGLHLSRPITSQTMKLKPISNFHSIRGHYKP